MDLISFLTTQFLAETIHGASAPQESDVRLQYLESLLTFEKDVAAPPHEEVRLLGAYLDLSIEDLELLLPEVNEWFLERLALRVPVQQLGRGKIERQVGRMFFLSGRGTLQYLAIGALLALDESQESVERSSVSFVWDHIWGDRGLTSAERNASISDVADILLDQYYFCGRSSYPFRALAQLHSSEAQFANEIPLADRPVYSRVAARIHLVGDPDDSPLGRLLRKREGPLL